MQPLTMFNPLKNYFSEKTLLFICNQFILSKFTLFTMFISVFILIYHFSLFFSCLFLVPTDYDFLVHCAMLYINNT